MGEMVVDLPQGVPALPTESTSFDLPAPFRIWFSTGGPHAGLVLAFAPLVLVVTFFMMVFAVETSASFIPGDFFILVLYGEAVVLLLAVATLRGRNARRRLVRDAEQHYAPRLQGAKDWFVRGDITEGEFEQLQGLIAPALTDKSPAIDAGSIAATVRSFALMLSIGLALLVPVNVLVTIVSLFEGGDAGVLLFALLIIDALSVFLILLSWRTAKVAAAAATTFDAQTAQRVDALEGEILRTARARRVGSGGVPSYGVGPSFRPYSGR